MKVLIDTNIILDSILEREPFVGAAITLFEMVEREEIQGYIAATTVTNIFYIVRKAQGRESALQAIDRILIGFKICPVNHSTIAEALNSNLKDFEDGIQLACATLNQLDAIVTRDISDFLGISLPVLSIPQLQIRLSQLGEC
ncbi:PIN domain-containing protein [Merismopedia glauca]|uniref:DNA-binding protein n=1 Tax=Merismopedia glauca CCAP 1448/3 TaxID=1296344 RepID=A0A2T1C5Y0_9CYAN|nr:PIN domain-containing protein [Merismopedia glauca]PSB03669.1 DNA-binding protein [Merismopedia glauca CCAP 1448/3]